MPKKLWRDDTILQTVCFSISSDCFCSMCSQKFAFIIIINNNNISNNDDDGDDDVDASVDNNNTCIKAVYKT